MESAGGRNSDSPLETEGISMRAGVEEEKSMDCADMIEDPGLTSHERVTTASKTKRKSESSSELQHHPSDTAEEDFQIVKRRNRSRTSSEPGPSSGHKRAGVSREGSKLIGEGMESLAGSPGIRSNITIWPEKISTLISNKYKANSLAPYTVFIECYKNTEGSDHALSSSPSRGVLALARKIHFFAASLLEVASDFRKNGRGRFSLNFPTYIDANNFIITFCKNSKNVFRDEVWFAYIPNFKIFKQVVARDVDADLDTDFIKANLRPYPRSGDIWVNPIRVERLTRRALRADGSGYDLMPSNSILITFDTSGIPGRAVLLGKNIFFTSFIPRVRRCALCLRFGHTKKFCKSSLANSLCDRCGNIDHSKDSCTSLTPRCINCVRDKRNDTAHSASDNECPVFLFNREVRFAMTMLALDFRDACDYIRMRGPLAKPDSQVPLPTFLDYLPPNLKDISHNNNNNLRSYAEVTKSHYSAFEKPTIAARSSNDSTSFTASSVSILPTNDSISTMISQASSIPSIAKDTSSENSRIPITDSLAAKFKSQTTIHSVATRVDSGIENSAAGTSTTITPARGIPSSPGLTSPSVKMNAFKDIIAKGLFRAKTFKGLPLTDRIKIDQVSAKLFDVINRPS